MSSSALKLLAASGAKGDPVYVDDVFSTFVYDGTGAAQGIQNGINLGDLGVGTSTRFDRNVDFLSRSSDLTGNADGKTFTFSCWVFLSPNYDGNARTLYATDSSDNGILIHLSEQRDIGVEAWNGGVRTLQASGSTAIGLNVWTHILVSVDMSNSSYRYIYINDVADSVTWNSYNNANIEFTRSTHYVGIWGNGTTRGFYQDMAHFYLDYTYRDLSTESNRRIFIDANGGSTSASSLTALNPIMYLPMTTAYAVGKNAGTGGDFTVNGSPTIVENGTEYVAGSGEGGLVWTKSRTNNHVHILIDTVRGNEKLLYSNDSWAEASSAGYITSFNNNGYSLGSASYMNDAAQDFASWTFRKQPGFFDIVTYTGDASIKNRAIPHNLGSTPGMVIIKSTGNRNWAVWHRGFTPHWTGGTTPNDVTGGNNVATILLDTTGAGGAVGWFTYVNDTAFGVDNNSSDYNVTNENYVAYVFAHDAQDFGTDRDEAIIKCGTFTEPSSGAVSVDLGFEPQFLLVKATGVSDNWRIYDMMRGMPVTPNTAALYPNTSGAEVTYTSASGPWPTPTATGFKWPSGQVGANEPWIYMAIRRPHKPAEEFAATDLYSPLSAQPITGGIFNHTHLADFSLYKYTGGAQSWAAQDRLRGLPDLSTDATAAENGLVGGNKWDRMEGYINPNPGAGGYSSWAWRRAPGYFDSVAYTGNGTAGRTVTHNLGAVPEMIWVKGRDVAGYWQVYNKTTGNNKRLLLNNTGAEQVEDRWYNTDPTSDVFTVGLTADVNGSTNTYIAYLFASVAGISKVGSYTGTGYDLNVDCGFSAGARFILIKRTDSTGDWYVWDSAQGIVAGNDPYLLLNTTAAQVTNTDYVDPLASGFTVTSSAPAALNASGGTYIFYAIA